MEKNCNALQATLKFLSLTCFSLCNIKLQFSFRKQSSHEFLLYLQLNTILPCQHALESGGPNLYITIKTTTTEAGNMVRDQAPPQRNTNQPLITTTGPEHKICRGRSQSQLTGSKLHIAQVAQEIKKSIAAGCESQAETVYPRGQPSDSAVYELEVH